MKQIQNSSIVTAWGKELQHELRYYSRRRAQGIINRIGMLTHSLGRLRRDLNNPDIKLSDLSQMFPVVFAPVLNGKEKRALIYTLFMTISKNPKWTRKGNVYWIEKMISKEIKAKKAKDMKLWNVANIDQAGNLKQAA